MWWKVESPAFPEFLVLVISGRVVTDSLPNAAARTRLVPGALWSEVHEEFEAEGFKCTMETL